jgi:hypothetical protein
MNIQETTITAYTFTVSESEMRAAIENPELFASQFKAVLNGAVNGGGHRIVEIASGRGTALKRYPKGKNGRGKKNAGLGTKPCLVCGRVIAEKYMALHVAKKHPDAKAE